MSTFTVIFFIAGTEARFEVLATDRSDAVVAARGRYLERYDCLLPSVVPALVVSHEVSI